MNKVQKSGSMDFSKINAANIKVEDLLDYFSTFLEKNISNSYITQDKEYHKDALPEEKKLKVLINNTRISTFFCFTDEKNILLFDRPHSNLQTIKNDSWDCFGSVTFENISIKLKIDNEKGFFDSDINKIESIPGFAYEDNIEENNNLTIIMFGFIIYISEKDLEKAITTNNQDLKIFSIDDNTLSNEVLTSKAQLAWSYLKERDCF